MPSFFDIQLERKLTPDEYLDTVHNSLKREEISCLFACAEEVIKFSRKDIYSCPDKPIIRVNTTAEIIAEGMHGFIEISEGFIEFCLLSQCAPIDLLVDYLPEDQRIPTVLQNTLFSWTIAHEYWHGIRRHNTVLESIANNHQNLRSIEIDADMCAAASMYRLAQAEMQRDYSDITIRKILFCNLFWAVRGMPESVEGSTHPCNFERIYHICTKIIHLRSNKYDPPDPNLSSDESRANIEPLINLMIRAELVYKSANPACNRNMIVFMNSFLQGSDWVYFAKAWEEMRVVVSEVSGTRT